jgi:arabinogalactan oligomer / maltooligosaccharide transport system permease protein
MTTLSYFKRTAFWGLGVSVAVALALSGWLHGSVSGDLGAEQKQREAVLITNAISASLAGATEQDLPARVKRWKTELPNVESAMVVAGRQLVASTKTEDEAPRSLKREEKPLFDLATQLRSAGETNVSEGIVRKKTVQIDTAGVVSGAGSVVVSVPYVVDGKFEGIVQARVKPQSATTSSSGWGLPMALVVAAFVIGALLRVKPDTWVDSGRVLAVVALLGLAFFFQQQRLSQMSEATAGADVAVSKVQAATAAVYSRIGATPLPASPHSRWDTDAFGRPLKLISLDGAVLPKAGGAVTDPHTGFLKSSFWGINLVALGVLMYFVLGYAGRTAAALRAHSDAYAYIAPAMIGMLVLVFFPFFYGIGLAFTDTTLFNESAPFRERWVGLQNFGAILGDFNIVTTGAEGTVVNYQNFYWTLMMTVIWTVTNVVVGVTIGFILAMALNTEGLKGKWLYRILLILPWAIPNYITALVWRGMFHPQFGVINQMLQMVGMEPVRWFDGVVSSFVTGLVTNGWLSFPFMMVVILGALQSIPKDMYEAAEVEGATRWQQLRRITLPLLRPTLVPSIILSVVWTFNMFNIIFLVSGGEPGGANEILITKAYKIAFEQYQYAYAAAYSTVIFIILLVYGYFQTRMTRATESY